MKNILILVLFFSGFFSKQANGQIEVKSPDSTKKQQTLQVTVYDQGQEIKDDSPKESLQDNIIKFNPVAIIRGELPLYYERKLNPRSSLEIGIGPLINNFMGAAFEEFSDESSEDDEIRIPQSDQYRASKGMMVRLSYRLYLDRRGYALSDHYFSPSFTYKSMKREVSVLNQYGEGSGTYRQDDRQAIEFSIVYGSQDLSKYDMFSIEWFAGIGVRKFTGDHLVYRNSNVPGGISYEVISENDDLIQPILILGFKVGLAW